MPWSTCTTRSPWVRLPTSAMNVLRALGSCAPGARGGRRGCPARRGRRGPRSRSPRSMPQTASVATLRGCAMACAKRGRSDTAPFSPWSASTCARRSREPSLPGGDDDPLAVLSAAPGYARRRRRTRWPSRSRPRAPARPRSCGPAGRRRRRTSRSPPSGCAKGVSRDDGRLRQLARPFLRRRGRASPAAAACRAAGALRQLLDGRLVERALAGVVIVRDLRQPLAGRVLGLARRARTGAPSR